MRVGGRGQKPLGSAGERGSGECNGGARECDGGAGGRGGGGRVASVCSNARALICVRARLEAAEGLLRLAAVALEAVVHAAWRACASVRQCARVGVRVRARVR